MRLFGSDKIAGIMDRLGLEEGQVIEHPWVTKSIEMAQRRVEQHNFEIRKQLLEYDDVMNKQREVIYGQRRQILEGGSLKEDILAAVDKILDAIIAGCSVSHSGVQETDSAALISGIKLKFGLDLDPSLCKEDNGSMLKEKLYGGLINVYEEKEASLGIEMMRHLERMVFLQIIDSKWKEHLYTMDNLREGIGLRAYGQRDPLIEYKREAFETFSSMISGIEEEAIEIIFRMQTAKPERFRGVFSSLNQEFSHPELGKFEMPRGESAPVDNSPHPDKIPVASPSPHKSPVKVGRNEPCPCGSGKKYKKCCGR